VPLWNTKSICIGINVPVIEGIDYALSTQSGNTYTVVTKVRGESAQHEAYAEISHHFLREFERSKELLDSRIEYTRPRNRSASRAQIAADSAPTLSLRFSTDCPYDEVGQVQCPPVTIEGPSLPPGSGPVDPLPPFYPPTMPSPPEVPGGGPHEPPIERPAETPCEKGCDRIRADGTSACMRRGGSPPARLLCITGVMAAYGTCLKECK
jgi:hypothetical protein